MTNSYYTKEQVDQQAFIIGEKLKGVSDSANNYTDSKSVTQEERDKLAGLESSRFLGSFLNPESIPVEGSSAGNYADVDSGTGSKVERWIFDVDTQEFIKSGAKATADTAATVKVKYESNPNTNAFSDEHKTKLEAILNITPAASIEDFLASFNAAITGIPVGTVLINLSELSSDLDSTPGLWTSRFHSNDAVYEAAPENPNYFLNVYGKKLVEEINIKYPEFNLDISEVIVTFNNLGEVYNVIPNPNSPRISGSLRGIFYPPL